MQMSAEFFRIGQCQLVRSYQKHTHNKCMHINTHTLSEYMYIVCVYDIYYTSLSTATSATNNSTNVCEEIYVVRPCD